MIQITLTFNSYADAVAALRSMPGVDADDDVFYAMTAAGAAEPAVVVDMPQPPIRARAPRGKKAETETETETVSTAPQIAAEPAALDYDSDVKPLLVGALQSAGMSKVQAVLKQFGAAKGSDVAAGKLAEFKVAIEALADAPQEVGLL